MEAVRGRIRNEQRGKSYSIDKTRNKTLAPQASGQKPKEQELASINRSSIAKELSKQEGNSRNGHVPQTYLAPHKLENYASVSSNRRPVHMRHKGGPIFPSNHTRTALHASTYAPSLVRARGVHKPRDSGEPAVC